MRLSRHGRSIHVARGGELNAKEVFLGTDLRDAGEGIFWYSADSVAMCHRLLVHDYPAAARMLKSAEESAGRIVMELRDTLHAVGVAAEEAK